MIWKKEYTDCGGAAGLEKNIEQGEMWIVLYFVLFFCVMQPNNY